MGNDIQEQIDAGAKAVPAKNGKPALSMEPGGTIDKAAYVAVLKGDLAKLEQAAENAKAQYHLFTGKAEAFRELIAYHEGS